MRLRVRSAWIVLAAVIPAAAAILASGGLRDGGVRAAGAIRATDETPATAQSAPVVRRAAEAGATRPAGGLEVANEEPQFCVRVFGDAPFGVSARLRLWDGDAPAEPAAKCAPAQLAHAFSEQVEHADPEEPAGKERSGGMMLLTQVATELPRDGEPFGWSVEVKDRSSERMLAFRRGRFDARGAAAERRDVVDVEIPRGTILFGELGGTVFGPDGDPAASASIEVRGGTPSCMSAREGDAGPPELGTFALHSVPVGKIQLLAALGNRARMLDADGPPAGGASKMMIHLGGEPRVFSGRVIDERGNGIDSVVASLTLAGTETTLEAMTDELGNFEFFGDGIEPAELTVYTGFDYRNAHIVKPFREVAPNFVFVVPAPAPGASNVAIDAFLDGTLVQGRYYCWVDGAERPVSGDRYATGCAASLMALINMEPGIHTITLLTTPATFTPIPAFACIGRATITAPIAAEQGKANANPAIRIDVVPCRAAMEVSLPPACRNSDRVAVWLRVTPAGVPLLSALIRSLGSSDETKDTIDVRSLPAGMPLDVEFLQNGAVVEKRRVGLKDGETLDLGVFPVK